VEQNAGSNIRHVIGIVSGKGGVGKSLVTASLANALAGTGARVGILDADITGPSIPKMYGLTGPAEALSETEILPLITSNGIKVMSLNLIMEDPEQAVIWRGPIIAGVVRQFWTDVVWGELDYLLVDMPPGTGDVPLTVFQSLPVDGIIVVTSPQELVGMIVGKAVKMAEMMNIPVLGIVENMSWFECDQCGKKHYIYGNSHIEETAASYGIKNIAQLPINPAFAQLGDSGNIESAGNVLAEFADKIFDALRA
jgi:Mrp family chromosome partitioning ATPase